jgi:hypothetical protein
MAVAFGKSCQKGPVASEVSLFDGHRPEFSIQSGRATRRRAVANLMGLGFDMIRSWSESTAGRTSVAVAHPGEAARDLEHRNGTVVSTYLSSQTVDKS